MRNTIICLLLFVGFVAVASAQNNVYWLKGIVKEADKSTVVPYASITNAASKKTTVADENGRFKIAVAANQLLTVSAIGYNFDTVRVDGNADSLLIVQLQSLKSRLKDVTVNARWSAYQLDSMERRKNYFGTKSSHKLTTFAPANSGAGIAFNLDRFYGSEKKKRKWIQLFEFTENEAYIAYRFNAPLVAKYTGLKGDELQQFMQKNRPSYDWLRANKQEEDLMYYINACLKQQP